MDALLNRPKDTACGHKMAVFTSQMSLNQRCTNQEDTRNDDEDTRTTTERRTTAAMTNNETKKRHQVTTNDHDNKERSYTR